MKKILSSLFILFLFFILAWGVAGWYFGEKAESDFRNYLLQSQNTPGEKLFRAELLSYKKTLLGAKAKIKISSDISFLNESLGDFELDVHLLNGPLFLNFKNENGVSNSFFGIGATRWRIRINKNSLDEEKAEYLGSLFPDGLPNAIVTSDFKNKAHYQTLLKTEFTLATISGVYNLDNDSNQGAVLLNKIKFGTPLNNIKANQATISYKHQRSITAAYKPATTQLSVTGLEISHESLNELLILDVSANAAILSEEHDKYSNVLNGLIKVHLKNISSNQIPVEKADIKIQFDNIPAQGFIALSEERARLENIRQQMQWTIEESGELPEGQDQLWRLNDQLQTMQNEFPQLLASLFLKTKDSQIRMDITTENSATANKNTQTDKNVQKSSLNGEISLNNAVETPQNSLDLLFGEAQVKLSDDLFAYLTPKIQLKNKEFKLYFQNGKLQIGSRK